MEIPTSDAGDVHLHNADVLDKDVYDLNGMKLGHVTLARETPSEGLISFDVALRGRASRALGTHAPVLTIASDHVVAADSDVTLDDDVTHLTFREHTSPLDYEED